MTDGLYDQNGKRHDFEVGGVPVYLPGRIEVGRAKVTEDGHHFEITIPGDSPIAELMADSLMGFSIMYVDQKAKEIVEDATLLQETQAENNEGEE